MNTVTVPYVKNLEKLSPKQLEEKLVSDGVCLKVENAPWKEYPYRPIVTVNLAADENYIFARFFVKGLGLKAIYSKTNEPVWQDSCVEVFIADADGQGYHNFEFNCIGTLLSSYRKARKVDVRPITEEDAAKILRYASAGIEPFEEIEGEHSWTLTVGIPFSLVGYDKRPDELQGNFYKCANYSKWPHYLSWAPIDTPAPDFHRPEFFGTLKLNKE